MKRHILEIVRLNFTLQDVTLVPTIRKPFDVLAEGLILKDGDPYGTPVELFCEGVWGLEPHVGRLILAA